MEPDFTRDLRNTVYRLLLSTGEIPKISALASELVCNEATVREGLSQLYAVKALALMPESGEILMASPWSAAPT